MCRYFYLGNTSSWYNVLLTAQRPNSYILCFSSSFSSPRRFAAPRIFIPFGE